MVDAALEHVFKDGNVVGLRYHMGRRVLSVRVQKVGVFVVRVVEQRRQFSTLDNTMKSDEVGSTARDNFEDMKRRNSCIS